MVPSRTLEPGVAVGPVMLSCRRVVGTASKWVRLQREAASRSWGRGVLSFGLG